MYKSIPGREMTYAKTIRQKKTWSLWIIEERPVQSLMEKYVQAPLFLILVRTENNSMITMHRWQQTGLIQVYDSTI